MNTPQSDHIPTPTRRHFVQRAATGLAALLAGPLHPAGAETMAGQPAVLTGSRFDLAVESRHVDFTGRRVNAVTVNGSSPGPTLKCREGDTVTIALTNHLPVETSIHWHGMRVPSSMDGVPGLSFAGIAPGKTFVYRFPLPQNGTYWYHSHSGFQEQTGLIGALIIEPKDKDPIACDRDYVVLLSDWSDTSAETLFSNLKKQSDYYDFHKRTAGTFIDNVRTQGLRFTVADRLNWGRMNMSPTDIADVTSATYVYLMNGRPANANWTALFTPGARVRLRLINGSAMTFFDVRIPGLPLTVVQADGNYVQPVTVDEIRLGVAETYDVIVQPHEDKAYTIFAQPESRGSYARGTLAPRMGMTAEIPPLDPVPVRSMADMGMGAMAQMNGMQMKGMTSPHMPGMDVPAVAMQGMNMSGMDMPGKGVTQGGMAQMKADMVPMKDGGMCATQTPGTIPFPQPGPCTAPTMLAVSAEMSGMAMSGTAGTSERAPRLHIGPEVVSVAMILRPGCTIPETG